MVAFGLGLYGWDSLHHATTLTDWANNLFRTFQLLTFQFPRDSPDSLPVSLNIARFMVPSIALLESYRLVLRAVSSPAQLAMLGFRHGHIILVPGKGPVGRAMLRDVQVNKLWAVAIAPDLSANDRAHMEEHRLPVLAADPFLEAIWYQTRAERAGLVVVSHGGDVENLNIVITVADALATWQHQSGPMLMVTLENEMLAEQVEVALDKAVRRSGLRYRRLSVADEAARAIFLEPPLPACKPDRARASHIVIVGLGPGARAVLRHALTFRRGIVRPVHHGTCPRQGRRRRTMATAGYDPGLCRKTAPDRLRSKREPD